MGRLAAIGVLLFACTTSFEACAGPAANEPGNSGASAPAASEDSVKTLKERLSDKASDDQRVDNCGVPFDRRGSRPRPDCAGDPPSLTAKGGDSGPAGSSLADQGSTSR